MARKSLEQRLAKRGTTPKPKGKPPNLEAMIKAGGFEPVALGGVKNLAKEFERLRLENETLKTAIKQLKPKAG
jgi:hypothetical protein